MSLCKSGKFLKTNKIYSSVSIKKKNLCQKKIPNFCWCMYSLHHYLPQVQQCLVPLGHLGFLGGQLKLFTLYVLRAAFCDLAMFFSSSSFSLEYISLQKLSHQKFLIALIHFHCRPAGETPVWVTAGQSRILGS